MTLAIRETAKLITWMALRAGKIIQILRCDWLPERTIELSCTPSITYRLLAVRFSLEVCVVVTRIEKLGREGLGIRREWCARRETLLLFLFALADSNARDLKRKGGLQAVYIICGRSLGIESLIHEQCNASFSSISLLFCGKTLTKMFKVCLKKSIGT